MRQENEAERSRKRLGAAIKRIRSERGLSRRDLEKQTELSYPYLSEIESGKKMPSTQSLRRLAQALGIEAHELLQEAEERQGWRASRPSHFHAPAPQASLPASEVDFDSGPNSVSSEEQLVELLHIARELAPADRALLVELAGRLLR